MSTLEYLIAALVAALLLGRPGPAQAQPALSAVGTAPDIVGSQ